MNLADYTFRYSAAAHLAACEKYPDGLTTELIKNDSNGFDALCWALVELSAQGELMRRHMGQDKKELLTLETVQAELMPYQLPDAKKLVMEAVIRGIQAPKDENSEVDVVLQELQKKTGKGSRKRST